ncbi:TetR/AcrR family transcriptional regulator [Sphaerisporangium corydalis]|uniref:TetR/AcrR family transcriptional regulator n=1 Tax=Sphaerisporangium corydalis TaxID=1441875 RepID=A0ABV9EQR8_9ACTN|nr:TetR/AcrR family transcriptional regulator [Sphaerisporangium corydalis]
MAQEPHPEPGATDDRAAAGPVRRQRADGRRNQARLLEAAFAAFAEHGASVSVREIARRAGVSTGTFSRHFPTKEELFAAVVLNRIGQLVQRADELAAGHDPATAFFSFFAVLVEESAADHSVGDALSSAGFDIHATASAANRDFGNVLHCLLARAQQAGAVRPDVDTADVKALVVGCLAREREGLDDAARQRMISVVCDGLRVRPSLPA